MKRNKSKIVIILFVGLALNSKTCFSLGHSWIKSSKGIFEQNVKKITTFGPSSQSVAASSSNILFINDGNQTEFNRSFYSKPNERINYLYYDKAFFSSFFVVTDNGIYQSLNMSRWTMVYGCSNDEKCLCLISFKGSLFIGTTKGFIRLEYVKGHWIRNNFINLNEPVYLLIKDEDNIYAVTRDRLLKVRNSKIETIIDVGKYLLDEDVPEEDVYGFSGRKIKSAGIFMGCEGNSIIYIASDNGIFFSNDNGKDWEQIPSENISLDQITSMVAICHGEKQNEPSNKMVLIVGTKKGAFLYHEGKWGPIYKGMEADRINDMAIGGNGSVYAATDKGVYFLDTNTPPSFISEQEIKTDAYELNENELEKLDQVLNKYEFEPDINEVHQWAIQYAEVDNEKIDEWRRLAKKKSWFPKVSIGMDQDRNRTLSDSIWGSYSSGGQQYVGTDDKTFYNNLGWDISLSWDLGKAIWNNEQTSIDSRSKMMVELREDILGQVSRVYYERRRLQIEIDMGLANDFLSLVDKKLRIKELTSLIDSYTMGRFSKEIEHRKNNLQNNSLGLTKGQ